MTPQMRNARAITRAAVIAALYMALTLLLAPISFGPMQLRVSEALTLLPVLWPEAAAGLFVGCFLSNLLGLYGVMDAVVGGLATLVAAMMTGALRRRRVLAALPPVLVNAVVIGALLHYQTGLPLWMMALEVGAGQALACYGLGLPLLAALDRTGLAQRL